MSGVWRDWFALGVLRFGLAPEAFWRLSVAEWLALVGSLGGGGRPPERAELARLCEAFPDE